MGNPSTHKIPMICPVSGKDLYVSELTSEDGSVSIRGRFEMPRLARLDPEQLSFLEVFLRSRGVISTVEKELGISYPTVRSRLDALLRSLDLMPLKDEQRREAERREAEKREVLKELEEGKISAAEAKRRLRGEAKQ